MTGFHVCDRRPLQLPRIGRSETPETKPNGSRPARYTNRPPPANPAMMRALARTWVCHEVPVAGGPAQKAFGASRSDRASRMHEAAGTFDGVFVGTEDVETRRRDHDQTPAILVRQNLQRPASMLKLVMANTSRSMRARLQPGQNVVSTSGTPRTLPTYT